MVNEDTKTILAELEQQDERDWRARILGLYMVGASDREVMCELELTPSKWNTLYSDLSCDFHETVEIGRVYSWAWWESEGRTNLNNKNFNASLWTINMKNRFGWSEKTEQSLTNLDLSNKDDQELLNMIKPMVKQLELRGNSSV